MTRKTDMEACSEKVGHVHEFPLGKCAWCEIERLQAAVVWMGNNWNADVADDGDRSAVPENIRDLIP